MCTQLSSNAACIILSSHEQTVSGVLCNCEKKRFFVRHTFVRLYTMIYAFRYSLWRTGDWSVKRRDSSAFVEYSVSFSFFFFFFFFCSFVKKHRKFSVEQRKKLRTTFNVIVDSIIVIMRVIEMRLLRWLNCDRVTIINVDY